MSILLPLVVIGWRSFIPVVVQPTLPDEIEVYHITGILAIRNLPDPYGPFLNEKKSLFHRHFP